MRQLLPLLFLLSACVSPGDRGATDYPDSLFTFQRVGANAVVIRRGFDIEEWATDLPDARGLAQASDGAVWVTLRSPGEVVRIPTERVGAHQRMLRHLRNPHGIAFRGDTVWVAETHQVIRSAPPYQRVDTVVRGLPDDGGHNTRSIIFVGDTLLVAIGSSCNLCDEADHRRAAIMAYDLDGGNERPWATGLRNSVGLALHPSGTLWATNNDRDRLGDDLPPERVNHIVRGGWYGWPVCYLPGTANPEYRAQAERCADAIGPAVPLPAHTAPLGLAFYTGSVFPPDYRGRLFVALHGSWDRSFPVGYKLVSIPFANGQPAGEPEDFVVGWQVGRQSFGRPVDVLMASDGALLVSDDQGGKIYRIVPD